MVSRLSEDIICCINIDINKLRYKYTFWKNIVFYLEPDWQQKASAVLPWQ